MYLSDPPSVIQVKGLLHIGFLLGVLQGREKPSLTTVHCKMVVLNFIPRIKALYPVLRGVINSKKKHFSCDSWELNSLWEVVWDKTR